MNINLKEQRARVAELLSILNDIEDTKNLFKDIDPEHVKNKTSERTEEYAERLRDFFKVTIANAKVLDTSFKN